MAVTQDPEYARTFPTSESLVERARRVLPGGLAHDSRHLAPFPLYVERARGSRKWTAEGRELVDFGMGHGALLLGHGNQAIQDAVVAQMARGTHFSACHPLEIEWAERICRLVPSAELVRFTNSGTEATMLAMRLCRAFTGRPRILKLQGHFHGWHDEATVGNGPDGATPATAGFNPATVTLTTAIPANDLAALRRELETGAYAGMILEPSGASWATVPLAAGYLQAVRDLTRQIGTLLIFDEVISGFRFAPGGAQELYGITPDLSTLAKAMAGGLPGGAVAGRGDVMDRLAFHDDERDQQKVTQQGTFNANPLSAAAGIAALEQLADGSAQRQATATAAKLCRGINGSLQALDEPGCAYHVQSVFHVYIGEDCPIWVEGDEIKGELDPVRLKRGMPGLGEFRRGLNERGVDLMRDGGLVSTVHGDEDIEIVVRAIEGTIRARRG
ncbi:MAG: aminotransferase class III-fold pyridoxal phosphate-dependent enzyme [Candidatus Dormiibacterota bacterium]